MFGTKNPRVTDEACKNNAAQQASAGLQMDSSNRRNCSPWIFHCRGTPSWGQIDQLDVSVPLPLVGKWRSTIRVILGSGYREYPRHVAISRRFPASPRASQRAYDDCGSGFLA